MLILKQNKIVEDCIDIFRDNKEIATIWKSERNIYFSHNSNELSFDEIFKIQSYLVENKLHL